MLQDEKEAAATYVDQISHKLWAQYAFPYPRYGHNTSNIVESLNSSWGRLRFLPALKMMDSIWSLVMKTFHDRYRRPQKSMVLADTPYVKFQERLKSSKRYKVFESGHGIYQVQKPDSGQKFIINLQKRVCDCTNFYEYQGPCTHAITACRFDREDPFDYFLLCYTLKVYRDTYKKSITSVSIENLTSNPRIRPPRLVKERGRPKTKRHRKGEAKRSQRRCRRCGELGHNTRTCIGLENRAGRGERARQWRQEQEDWEVDVMMEGLGKEAEAQVQREASNNNVDMDSDSELSQLRSSDLEGIEL